jgi:hypothetical protein
MEKMTKADLELAFGLPWMTFWINIVKSIISKTKNYHYCFAITIMEYIHTTDVSNGCLVHWTMLFPLPDHNPWQLEGVSLTKYVQHQK